jgi:hypothetical protein
MGVVLFQRRTSARVNEWGCPGDGTFTGGKRGNGKCPLQDLHGDWENAGWGGFITMAVSGLGLTMKLFSDGQASRVERLLNIPDTKYQVWVVAPNGEKCIGLGDSS